MKLGIVLQGLAALTFATSAWAQTQPILPSQWQSTHNAANSLVGQIYSGAGTPVSQQELMAATARANFVLLGENHDNPDHHLIQANILRVVTSSSRRPALVWEMVPQRLADQINKYDLTIDPQLNDYALRLEWEQRGWYSWDIYRPIALVAARAGLTMVAGNLDRSQTRDISKKGVEVLSSQQQAAFALTTPLAQQTQENLVEELRQSHCNLLPDRALPSMVTVQRARDGALADAMIRSSVGNESDGAVLIAGNGHIRNDRAAPFVLRQRLDGQASSIAIAILEVAPGETDFADYIAPSSQEATATKSVPPLYDFVIFTPKFDNTDHCAALHEQFKKMKKTKP
ncbi:MAG: ChaN family lipoprotein [Rhizobiaceae bacterium]